MPWVLFVLFSCFLRWGFIVINFPHRIAFAASHNFGFFYLHYHLSLGIFKFPLLFLQWSISCLASYCLVSFFAVLFLLLISTFIVLWLEKKRFDMFSVFLIYWGLICGPRCDLSWRMFHVHLRRRCILLISDGVFCKYQLTLSCLMCYVKSVFLCCFLFGWSVHRCKWGVKFPHYYCIIVNFFFYGC